VVVEAGYRLTLRPSLTRCVAMRSHDEEWKRLELKVNHGQECHAVYQSEVGVIEDHIVLNILMVRLHRCTA
jgi:hypothetical protein